MNARPRVGLLATHPIQYYAPWYRALAKDVDLHVYFSHQQTAAGQADAGFGVEFEWDVPLLEGYRSTFLENVARRPDVNRLFGCSTPSIARIIADSRFDAFIVHGWGTQSYWQAMRACWRTRTPILVRGDSSLTTPSPAWRRALKAPLYRWFIPRFDAYLIVGTRAKDYLLHYGADPAKCFSSPHAVDNERFAAESDRWRVQRADVRRQLGLPVDATVFLFAGKLIPLKRPELFVEAIARASNSTPGIAGVIVGDGPLRSATEALATRLHAPVRFAGFLNQREMARAYAVADVLILPSERETWGLTVNEAMACGLPAIVTDAVGCADDLVRHGKTGLRVPVDDRAALTSAIARLHENAAERQSMAAAARALMKAFTLDEAAAGVVRAVESVSEAAAALKRASATMPAVGTTR